MQSVLYNWIIKVYTFYFLMPLVFNDFFLYLTKITALF